MRIDSDTLVQLLNDAWSKGRCVAHNWQSDRFEGQAQVIWQWCESRKIDWGADSGYPVQTAQRTERGRPKPRIAAYQEPGGRRRIMFSLSKAANPKAYAAALSLAKRHGFKPLA
jgi:hypothetical protein